MISIENKNLKEHKIIQTIMIFLMVALLILAVFIILGLVNQDLSLLPVRFLFFGFLIILTFLNYLRHLASTRYFSLSIFGEDLTYEGIRKEFNFKIADIRRVIYLRQHDISGITNYMIIIRKGFKRYIFASDFKSKSCDLKKLNDNDQFSKIKTINITNSFLSQIVLTFYLTLSI